MINISDNNVDLIANINDNTEIIASIETEVQLEAQLTSDANISVNIIGVGARGPQGEIGLSAYQIWLAEGNEGTVEDFLLYGGYSHPKTHPADIIEETDEKRFISSADILKLSGFVHDQIEASATWEVVHTLDKFPSVAIVDSGGNHVYGGVTYESKDRLIIRFSSEFSGKAYLN